MANSKFILTFLAMPSVNDEIHIEESSLGLDLKEIFKNARLGLYQTKLPKLIDISEDDTPILVYDGNIATNYKTAFNLDHNSTGLFTITSTGSDEPGIGLGTVTVEANYPGAVFVDNNTLPGVMSVEVINEGAPEEIEIDSITFSEADTNPCQNVKVTVATSVLATKVISTIPLRPPTEASSNMLLYSEDLSNTEWEKENVILDGNKVISNDTYGYHSVSQVVNKGSSAGQYTFSFLVKESDFNIVNINLAENIGSGQFDTAFNVATQTFLYAFGLSGFTGVSSTFTNEGEGYYRVSIKVGVTTYPDIKLKVTLRNAGGNVDYTGDNTSGIYLDKFQFQEGNLTPYLQTTDTALDVPQSDGTTIDPNTDNPIEFTALRSSSGSIRVENEGSHAIQSFQVPVALNESNFSIGVSNSPNGATVTVSNTLSTGLELEYSLNGDDWQESNIFSGLESDDYTLYVRDQLGCSFEIDFNVNDDAIYVPYFYYSKSNSLRLAERITWGDAANYKTDENTLSCEVDVENVHHEIQFFQTADLVTCQFKSNYATNSVKVIKSDLSEDTIAVVKKSDNIGIKDKRDARKYNLGGGKVGIYFLSGNKYDYDTNAVTGTHALNGLVPEWGIVGNYINIGGSWFLIEQVVFDESKNADVLVITETYAGAEIDIIVGCVYNIYPYEVYEFSIDMADYQDQRIKVKMTMTDTHFQTIECLSEEIDVKVKQEFTKDINYWNNNNNDVSYATGIRHRIRMPYTRIENGDEDESSNHKTDTNAILLSADLYEGEKFIFEPTTKEMWRKLKMALSHKNVYIDGVKYVKNGDFESEGPLDNSNLYVLKATMLKAGSVYNSDGSDFGAGASGVEIPGMIEGNDSFVKY